MQRICLNFRDQWPNLTGNYTDYNVSYDRNLIDSNFGIGLLANQDRAGQGTIINTHASLLLAYQFHIKKSTLSLGVQGTYFQSYLNQSKLVFGDQIDPRRGFIYSTNEQMVKTKVSVADFSAGILGYGKYYFAGFALDHVTQPDVSFVTGVSPLPIKYTINCGGIIPVGKFTLSPAFIYQKQRDSNLEQPELYATYKFISLGIGYRWNDATIFTLGFQTKFLRVGYSYDYTVSSLTNSATDGSHEATVVVLLPY